jgi:hypothetical protein
MAEPVLDSLFAALETDDRTVLQGAQGPPPARRCECGSCGSGGWRTGITGCSSAGIPSGWLRRAARAVWSRIPSGRGRCCLGNPWVVRRRLPNRRGCGAGGLGGCGVVRGGSRRHARVSGVGSRASRAKCTRDQWSRNSVAVWVSFALSRQKAGRIVSQTRAPTSRVRQSRHRPSHRISAREQRDIAPDILEAYRQYLFETA